MAEYTVGISVFAITHGMKWGCMRPSIPWVLAFLRLPTVENGDLRHRAYRGFWRFRDYQRYKTAICTALRTVGFGVFAITHGMKLGYTRPSIPGVFAFSRLPTV